MNSLQPTKPHVVVIVGLPGAGKSFFAKKFCETFNAPCVDYNDYRKIAGDEAGGKLADHTLGQLLKTKQTVVVEGIGSTLSERRNLVAWAHKKGYATLFVWVQTEPVTAEQRAVRSKNATMKADEFVRHARMFENLTNKENYAVISGKHTYASQARVVLKKLVVSRPTLSNSGLRQLPRRNRIIG